MNTDAERLVYAMQEIDGFACLDADKYEYVQDEATRHNRAEPNDEDTLNGIRRMIDDAMLTGDCAKVEGR